MEFNFEFDLFGEQTEKPAPEPQTEAPRSGAHRRKSACIELTTKYEYRRAFSEVSLLESMKYTKLEKGKAYYFITGGDVDSLSYLKVVLNQHDLDHVLLSTWCMAAEDILQLLEWYKAGRIKKLDMYLGEIFPGSYTVEWNMVKAFYIRHPEAGCVKVFKNHSKVYAGYCEAEDFYFGIQTSANINTNPRTEQGSIVVDRQLYDFYNDYFSGINSIAHE